MTPSSQFLKNFWTHSIISVTSYNDQPQSEEDDIPVVIVPNIESAAAPMTASPDPPSDRPFTIGTNILRAPAVTPHYHYNHPAHPSVHHTFIHCAHVRIGNTWCQKNEFDIFNKLFRKIFTSSHHLTMTIKNLYCYKKVQQFHWQCNYETRIEFQKISQTTKVQGQPSISHEKSRLAITWLL